MKKGGNHKKPKTNRLGKKPVFTDHLFSKYPLLILCSVISLIVLIVFRKFIFQYNLYLFTDVGGDSLNIYYPIYFFNADYFWKNGIATWSFQQGMGTAAYPGGINDPFLLILILIGTSNIASGIIYIEILKIFIAGILFFHYAKTIKLSNYTAIIGGLAASFMGYLILGSSGWYGHSSGVVYSLFLILAFEKFYIEKKKYLIPIAVFLMASTPFKLYLNVVFLATYSLIRILSDNKLNFKELIIFYSKLLFWGIIGFLMSLFLSIGSIREMLFSPRGTGEVANEGNNWSATPVFQTETTEHYLSAIYRFFSNDILGAGSSFSGWYNYLQAPVFYVGILTLFLTPILFSLKNKRKVILFSLFLVAWLIPVILPFFRYALYLFVGSYYKFGISFFIPFIFLFVGIQSLENVFKKKISLVYILIPFLLLMALLFINLWFNPGKLPVTVDHQIQSRIFIFLIIYAVLLFLTRIKKYRPFVKVALLVVFSFELGFSAYTTTNQRETLKKEDLSKKTGYNDYTVEALNYLKKHDQSFFRINKNYPSNYTQLSTYNDSKVQGFFGTTSYSSMNNINYIHFLQEIGEIKEGDESATRWSKGLIYRYLLHGMASVKYNLIKSDTGYASRFGNDSIAHFGDVTVMKNKYYLPLGFCYDKYIELNNFKKLSKNWKDLFLYRAFVVENKTELPESMKKIPLSDTSTNYSWNIHYQTINKLKQDTLAINKFSQNYFKGEISLNKPNMLFLSIPYDIGWQAYVNGEKVKTHKINIGFTGIFLPDGNHKIELKYKVPYLFISSILSIIAFIFFIGYLLHWKGILNIQWLNQTTTKNQFSNK